MRATFSSCTLLMGIFLLLLLPFCVTALREYEENSSDNKSNNNNNARRRHNNNNNKKTAATVQAEYKNGHSSKPKKQHKFEKNSTPALLQDSEEFVYAEDYELLELPAMDVLSYNSDETADHIKTKLNAPYDIFTCCNEVFGSCRTSCENLSLVHLATTSDLNSGRGPRMELKKYCPPMQVEFWSCMNRTLDAVQAGAQWSGRRCCHLGLLPHCRNACATSSNLAELNAAQICRRSDEQHMFSCFERQDEGDRCCGNARTSECLQACRDVFELTTTTTTTMMTTATAQTSNADGNDNVNNNNNNEKLANACGTQNADVLECISNTTDMAPLANAHKYLPCCNYADQEHCRATCRTLLRNNSSATGGTISSETVFVRLEAAGCGTPLPHLPLWQCFLTATRKLYVPALAVVGHSKTDATNAISQLRQLGIDAAKLHCCEQAATPKCRRLCAQIYSTDWLQSREQFEAHCLQPATEEMELRRCLDSVDAPCELGCNGLSFCTNFNNRPTELFRSCTPAADIAARADLKLLEQRGFISVLGVDLHIKNTTRCEPSKWKALVCSLHLKPCTRAGLYNNICRQDCYELLNECMDWTPHVAAGFNNLNADAVCARLQPGGLASEKAAAAGEEPPPCVSLHPYLEKSVVSLAQQNELSAPCQTASCNASELCIAQRNGVNNYSCIPGCALGETSSFMVPFGAYVRVPVVGKTQRESSVVGAGAVAEYLVCRCAMQGRIEHCQPLPSYTHAHCSLPGGRSIRHGDSFYLECNICSCFAGEITCTKKQCRMAGYDAAYTSLPCNCPAHYVPVCGNNGNTYHSACLAKCFGLQETEYVYGACDTRHACQTNSHDCNPGTQCIAKRKICLSSMQRPCQQYVCVNQTSNCLHQSAEPVCDIQGRTHVNACALLNNSSPAYFAYWGNCQMMGGCSNQANPVCGINGVTYASECAAWADYILIDYMGRCRDVGLLAADLGARCHTVKCTQLPSKHCRRIVPPGACCPICAGGAFRIIYSRKQLDRAMYALRGQHRDLLTLHGVLHELDALVQISECQLTGFLSMEVGIFVALVPRRAIESPPTRLQLDACAREAEKLSSLISAQAPRITTNLVLSSLTVSHMLDPSLYNKAVALSGVMSIWILPLLLCLLQFKWYRNVGLLYS